MTQGTWQPPGGQQPPWPGPPPAMPPPAMPPPAMPPPAMPPPAMPPPVMAAPPVVPPPIWGPPAPLTYPGAGRIRPKARWTVALPAIGAVLVAMCLLVLPWVHAGDQWMILPRITRAMPSNASGFGATYVSGACYALALFAILYAFAATLDSTGLRWAHFACMAAVALFIMLGVVFAIAVPTRNGAGQALPHSDDFGTRVVIGLVGVAALLGIGLGLALARGLVVRVIGGLLLAGYTLVHLIALADLVSKKAQLLPFAWVGAVGYLLCAVGAFLGPAYRPATW